MFSQQGRSRVTSPDSRVRQYLRELVKICGQARDMGFTAHEAFCREANSNDRVEFDWQISLPNIGIKLRWRRVAKIATGIDTNTRTGRLLVGS